MPTTEFGGLSGGMMELLVVVEGGGNGMVEDGEEDEVEWDGMRWDMMGI